MSLTEQQAREMEKQLVLRILGDACTEYSHAAEELERRKDFRSYVMRRAESSGYTLDEIAAATELSPSDVEGFLRDGDGGGGGGGGGGVASGTDREVPTDAGADAVTAIFVGLGDAAGTNDGDHRAPEAIGGDDDLLVDDTETVLEVAPPFDVIAAVTQSEASDALGFDDIAETIGHLNLQIGYEVDEPDEVTSGASVSMEAHADAGEGSTDRDAEDQRIRSAWSWNRR